MAGELILIIDDNDKSASSFGTSFGSKGDSGDEEHARSHVGLWRR
jgi:hypothetical protein